MWMNSVMAGLLKSRLHSMVSKNMILVMVTGRKSGKLISTPTAYLKDGSTLWIISQRTSKWWRNLRGGAKMKIVLEGKTLDAFGSVMEDEQAVAQRLFENFKIDPKRAGFAKVKLDENSVPVYADCEQAAKIMLAVKVDLVENP